MSETDRTNNCPFYKIRSSFGDFFQCGRGSLCALDSNECYFANNREIPDIRECNRFKQLNIKITYFYSRRLFMECKGAGRREPVSFEAWAQNFDL